MADFKRIDEFQVPLNINGDYTRYEALYYEGPYTEYPSWAQCLFQHGALVAPRADVLMYDPSQVDYPNYELHKAVKQPLHAGDWLLHTISKKGDKSLTQLRAISTEDLREEFFPTSDLNTDEHEAFFGKDLAETRSVMIQVPQKFEAFQWQGSLIGIPQWLAQAITHRQVGFTGNSLHPQWWPGAPVRPGGWVLYAFGKPIQGMSNEQFIKEFGA